MVKFCGYQDSRSLLLDALSLSKNEGFCLGVKLVRGAYMDKERKLAMKEGHQDPIHQSWEDTNDRLVRQKENVLSATVNYHFCLSWFDSWYISRLLEQL